VTYCIGLLVDAGLVMIADTRTNAGVDNISRYRKLHVLADAPDRLVLCATAGNLSLSQLALATLAEGLPGGEGEAPRTMAGVPSLFRAAALVGEAVAAARGRLAPGLEAEGVHAGISLLVGGRIGEEPLRLFLVYEAGNFIECQADQPFLAIGDTKYGKPILDRTMTTGTALDEAVKIGLISFDSTMRSNLSVGRPLDLVAVPSDRGEPTIHRRIEADDGYFNDLSARWSMLLNEVRATIPPPPFMQPTG